MQGCGAPCELDIRVPAYVGPGAWGLERRAVMPIWRQLYKAWRMYGSAHHNDPCGPLQARSASRPTVKRHPIASSASRYRRAPHAREAGAARGAQGGAKRYEGAWRQGRRHGQGTEWYPSGEVYSGARGSAG